MLNPDKARLSVKLCHDEMCTQGPQINETGVGNGACLACKLWIFVAQLQCSANTEC